MAEKEIPLALVSGSAHRLGRTFALALARLGYAIQLHYHASKDQAVATAREIQALGVPAYPIQADLASPEQIRMVFTTLDSIPHHLRVLVNSAAIMPREDVRDPVCFGLGCHPGLELTSSLLARSAGGRSDGGRWFDCQCDGHRRGKDLERFSGLHGQQSRLWSR